jgi:hypothetical protein
VNTYCWLVSFDQLRVRPFQNTQHRRLASVEVYRESETGRTFTSHKFNFRFFSVDTQPEAEFSAVQVSRQLSARRRGRRMDKPDELDLINAVTGQVDSSFRLRDLSGA